MPHSHVPSSFSRHCLRTTLAWTLGVLVCLLAWDALGQDRALAHAFGTGSGFPMREHWLFSQVLHEGARRVGWLLMLLVALGVWWPIGLLRRIDLGERLQLAISVLVALGVVSSLKSLNATSCPWDLAEFGGVARYVPHWQSIWGHVADGGPGRCFPSGHAAAAFAFIGGWFVLRPYQPRAARLWLMGVLVCGVLFGVGQFLRGAHYPSHTLWTAWLCWALSAALLQPRGDAPNRVSKPRV